MPKTEKRPSAERIGRHELNMLIAQLVSRRSTCERAQVGCVITQESRVVSTGYGGAPSGLPHCLENGCEIGLDGGCIRTSHAEAGAIAFAARKGVSLEGSSIYVTLSPCLSCAKLIINAGISYVYFDNPYRDTSGIDLLQGAGIPVMNISVRKEG